MQGQAERSRCSAGSWVWLTLSHGASGAADSTLHLIYFKSLLCPLMENWTLFRLWWYPWTGKWKVSD